LENQEPLPGGATLGIFTFSQPNERLKQVFERRKKKIKCFSFFFLFYV
jgi:hypothetical protein